MKRIIVMVLKNIIFVPYYWIMLNWYAVHVDKYTEEQRYAMLKKIDHAANRGGNLHIDGHGVENIPSQNGFMFYPNHQGLYNGGLPGTFFSSCKEGSWKCTVFEAGIFMYEGIFD